MIMDNLLDVAGSTGTPQLKRRTPYKLILADMEYDALFLGGNSHQMLGLNIFGVTREENNHREYFIVGVRDYAITGNRIKPLHPESVTELMLTPADKLFRGLVSRMRKVGIHG